MYFLSASDKKCFMVATVSPQDVEYFGRNYDELGVGSAKVSNYLPNAIIVT